MESKIRELSDKDIEFVSEVYSENIEVLHGAVISLNEWKECFCSNTDCDAVSDGVERDGVVFRKEIAM